MGAGIVTNQRARFHFVSRGTYAKMVGAYVAEAANCKYIHKASS